MSKTIGDFFKPKSKTKPKRTADSAGLDVQLSPPKKQGTGSDGKSLTPEQVQRMEDNKKNAMVKLAIKKGTPNQYLMDESWLSILKSEFSMPYFTNLMSFLAKEKTAGKTIFPPVDEVHSWSKVSFKDVRVVIIGQDPYHTPGAAHGLCFSVKHGQPIPPSLHNIYKLLAKDVPGFKTPKHGYLDSWVSQGVLMLNAVLTVEKHKANSHAKQGWENFTDAIIKALNTRRDGLVFMLWGGYAQKKGKGIDKKKHKVFTTIHPSPLSFNRMPDKWLGSELFSGANKYLKEKGKPTIDWCSIMNG